LLFVVLHIDQHDTYRASRLRSIEETRAKERYHVEIIQDNNIALGIKDVNRFRGAALPNHAQVRPFAKQTNQCLTNEAILD
jgi:hypothetical protein